GLEAIGAAPTPLARARKSRSDRQIEQQRAIGCELWMYCAGETVDERRVDPAATSLVGARGIRESIADYPLSRLERREDDILDVQGARSEHEQRLGHSRDRFTTAFEHDAAHPFGERRASGLAGEPHRDPLPRKPVTDALRDRRLAGALD